MSTSMVDSFRAYDAVRAEDSARNRQLAAEQWPEAQRLAETAGLQLLRCTEAHYQLRSEEWILNIYPGNRRLYSDPNKPRPPFVGQPDWTLLQVVQEVVARQPPKDTGCGLLQAVGARRATRAAYAGIATLQGSVQADPEKTRLFAQERAAHCVETLILPRVLTTAKLGGHQISHQLTFPHDLQPSFTAARLEALGYQVTVRHRLQTVGSATISCTHLIVDWSCPLEGV